MSERPTGSGKSVRLRLAWVTGGILLALALAVVMLRFHRLTELPPGLYHDEGAHGVNALQVMQGDHAVFFPDNNGREGLIVYAIALAISFLGRTALAIRLPTALASAATVFAVFWLGWRLFGEDEENGRASPWRGLLIGSVGAGLLAVSLGQTVLGRTAFRGNFLTLLLSLCLALLWWEWRQHSWWRAALAGACTGLLAYTYTPAYFTLFLLLFFGLSFLYPFGAASNWKARIGQLKRNLPWVGVIVGVAALVAAPILIYFALNPDQFFLRGGQVSVFHPSRNQGNPLGAFVANVWPHLLVYGFRGDMNWRHNFASQPMLSAWEAFFFWLGVGMAVWRWQRPAYRLLVLWLAVLSLPAMLAIDVFPPPNTLRMIGAAPAVYLLAAVGVWETYRFLTERRGAIQEHANPVIQARAAWAARSLVVVVSGAILVQGALTYRAYFQEYAVAPEVFEAYKVEWTQLARALNAQPAASDQVYLIPHPKVEQPYGFEYLYHGAAPAHYVHATTPHNLAQKTELTLAALENVATVKVVDWDNDLVGGDAKADEHLAVLLGKFGQYLSSETYDSFHIHTYTGIHLDRPWTLYEHLEPLTVHYDGGISLHGIAVGRGVEQLSTQSMIELGEYRSLWVALQWQTAPGLENDYSISLRLHDSEGGGVYQRDAVLTNSEPSSTRHWSADEQVDTLVYLDIPASIPPGEYELRLVVYDFETLKPTVELGVWEAETVLARLRLAGVE